MSLWNFSENIPLNEKMMKMTINIVKKTNFGYNIFEEEISKHLLDGYLKVFSDLDDILLGFWYFGRGDSREEFERNNQNFKNTVKKIKLKTGDSCEQSLFLDYLMNSFEDEDKIIHQAVCSLVPGIHESATLMTFFFYSLGFHPQIQRKVQEEIQKTVKKKKSIKSMETMENLFFTKRVIYEILWSIKLRTL